MRDHIGNTALKRLRLKLCFLLVRDFGRVVDWFTAAALSDAAQLAVIGEDFRSPAGFRRLNRIAEARIAKDSGTWATYLREASPAIRKAILAAVFGWLRAQFPILNAPAAVAAAGVLVTLLRTRNDAE